MKKIFFLLALSFSALLGAKEPSGPAQLTVMSYNIRYGDAQDGTNSWQYRYPASYSMIMDQQPDILGLQEALDYQVKFLEEYCKNYKCVGVGRENGKHEGEHMSIFYNKKKIRLIKWGTFWLSETPSKPSLGWDGACYRTATWALMEATSSNRKFFYVNTHLDHVGVEARKNGLALIQQKIAELNPEGYPVVVTGDFNMTQDSPELEEFGKSMSNARKTAMKTDNNITYHGWGKKEASQQIDHIYYNGFSSCMVFEVVTKSYNTLKYISDHYPVKAVLLF